MNFPTSFSTTQKPGYNYVWPLVGFVLTLIGLIIANIYYDVIALMLPLSILALLCFIATTILGLINFETLSKANLIDVQTSIVNAANSAITNIYQEANMDITSYNKTTGYVSAGNLLNNVTLANSNSTIANNSYITTNNNLQNSISEIQNNTTNINNSTLGINNLLGDIATINSYDLNAITANMSNYTNQVNLNNQNIRYLATNTLTPKFLLRKLVVLANLPGLTNSKNSILINQNLTNYLTSFITSSFDNHTLLSDSNGQVVGIYYNYLSGTLTMDFIFIVIDGEVYTIYFQNGLLAFVIDPYHRMLISLDKPVIIDLLTNMCYEYSFQALPTTLNYNQFNIVVAPTAWVINTPSQFKQINANLLLNSLYNTNGLISTNYTWLVANNILQVNLSVALNNLSLSFGFNGKINLGDLEINNVNNHITAATKTNLVNLSGVDPDTF